MFSLIAQYLEKYSRYSTTTSTQGLVLSESARRATDRRWEIELKDCQQWQMEGRLQFHSHLTLMAFTFTSLKVSNSKVRIKGT